MNHMPLNRAAIALCIALALAACQPGDDTPDAAADDATTAADAADGSLQIEGLPTEKDQVSYMVGMDIGESLEQIRDEVDIDVVIEAMQATLAGEGEEAKLTDEQRQQVRQRFAAALQEKRAAEMQAKAQANTAEGAAFLAANQEKPGVVATASGLQYQVLEEGDGAKPTAEDVVRVHYKGTLLDGTEFDSSYERGEPAMFALQQVVPGWQEGIALMPVGSKYRLWIPSDLAYGEMGTPNGEIGPNATLVFEVELLEIVEAPAG